MPLTRMRTHLGQLADEVVERKKVCAAVPVGDTFKWVAEGAWTIVQVTFHNYGINPYGGAGHESEVQNAAASVVKSTNDLAADAVEEKVDGELDNTAVADGAEITLICSDTAGGESFICVTLEKKLNT